MSDEIKRRKAEEDRKTKWLRARVKPEHKVLIQQAADRAGIGMSAWIVITLVRIAREELGET